MAVVYTCLSLFDGLLLLSTGSPLLGRLCHGEVRVETAQHTRVIPVSAHKKVLCFILLSSRLYLNVTKGSWWHSSNTLTSNVSLPNLMWESRYLQAVDRQFTTQNLDQLHVLVFSALPTTHHNITNKVPGGCKGQQNQSSQPIFCPWILKLVDCYGSVAPSSPL